MSRSERALLAIMSAGMVLLTAAVYALILSLGQLDAHVQNMRREITALMQAVYSTAHPYNPPGKPYTPTRRTPTSPPRAQP